MFWGFGFFWVGSVFCWVGEWFGGGVGRGERRLGIKGVSRG